MINVQRKPEPSNFDNRVRKPGNSYLAKCGTPKKSGGFPRFWKNAVNDLHVAYDGICAYTCRYIIPPGTVDHYLPKMQYPNLAYEWDNYRLASQRANAKKGESTDVVDPFDVVNGWFEIDFPSCLVTTGADAPAAIRDKLKKTIDVLKLNDDDSLVQDRCDMMLMLADGDVTINYLTRRYPFLASEIARQNISAQLSNLFKRRTLGA